MKKTNTYSAQYKLIQKPANTEDASLENENQVHNNNPKKE